MKSRQLHAQNAKRNDVAALYLFSSYARGEATAQNDIGFRLDRNSMTDMLAPGGFYCDLKDAFQKKPDVLTTQIFSSDFLKSIQADEILIYTRN